MEGRRTAIDRGTVGEYVKNVYPTNAFAIKMQVRVGCSQSLQYIFPFCPEGLICIGILGATTAAGLPHTPIGLLLSSQYDDWCIR